jgi:hypothetical protein
MSCGYPATGAISRVDRLRIPMREAETPIHVLKSFVGQFVRVMYEPTPPYLVVRGREHIGDKLIGGSKLDEYSCRQVGIFQNGLDALWCDRYDFQAHLLDCLSICVMHVILRVGIGCALESSVEDRPTDGTAAGSTAHKDAENDEIPDPDIAKIVDHSGGFQG